MKKLIALAVFIISVCDEATAQTDPLYAQYLNNPFVINPAYSGYQNNFTATLSYRKQWAGFDGSPVTVNASAHTSLIENKMGGGLMIVQDKIGASKNTDVVATYSYRVDFGEQRLTFGLQGGFTNYRTDYSDLNVYDPGSGEFLSNQNITKPAFGAGALFSGDRFMVGLSVPRMLKHKESFDGDDIEVYQQHAYLSAAYTIFISERVRFKPSVLMRAVKGAPVSGDYHASFNFDERYTAGMYTRNFEAYGILAQAQLGDRYRLGYAFEMPTNQSVGTRYTSHEITLGVSLAIFDFHDIAGVSSF